jgi:hypothetical protein
MSYISLKVSERRLPTYFFVQAILRVRMFEKFAFTFADGFGTKTCLSWLVTKGQNAGGNSTYLSHHMSVSMAHGSFGSISNSETMLSKNCFYFIEFTPFFHHAKGETSLGFIG